MNVQLLPWNEIVPGHFLQDPQLKLWRVDDARSGWLRVRDVDGAVLDLPPPPDPDSPQWNVVVPTPAQAEQLVSEVLGARAWGRVEALAAQPVRAARWPAKPFSVYTRGGSNMAAGHLRLAHGELVEDIIGKAGWTKKVTEAHEALHADPNHIMRRPHHHQEVR